MSTRSKRLLATSLLLVAVSVGCANSATGPTPSVTGTWTGRATVTAELTPTFTLSLVQTDDGSITGSGHLATEDGAYAVDVTIGAGTNNFPSITFAILNPTRGDILFTGVMDETGTTIRGTLSGTGMEGLPLGLVRR